MPWEPFPAPYIAMSLPMSRSKVTGTHGGGGGSSSSGSGSGSAAATCEPVLAASHKLMLAAQVGVLDVER